MSAFFLYIGKTRRSRRKSYKYRIFFDMNIYLKTGEKLPQTIKNGLITANSNLTTTKDHSNYINELKTIFGLSSRKVGIREKYFLGGFIEGDGSINVSAKKHRNAPHGIHIDPEFSLTQHVNGVELLILALILFQTGRIRYKSGSNATLILIIQDRDELQDKVVPFYKKYVNSIGSAVKAERIQKFEKMLIHIKKKNHEDLNILVNDLLPLWDSMRMQTGQKNQTFASLAEAQAYAKNPNK